MIYTYRALIPESKVFFRVYEVKSEMTLFSFNAFILNDLGFAPDQMVLFRGYDKKGVLCSEYGLFDMGDGAIDAVSFEKMIRKGEVEFHYVFDLREERYIRFLYEGEGEFSNKISYPCMISEKGRNPDQFSKRYEDIDEYGEAHEPIVEEEQIYTDESGEENE
ncbi:MAG: hypothetical protein PHD07_03255 [Bacteroidales bacterium]|nr:hypothetical protein [Bacteroidales bacterium]